MLPGSRINEVGLSDELQVSRTPLREALNRLSAEGVLVAGDRGFQVPELDPNLVRELFEARTEIECSGIRLACQRAKDDELDSLASFLVESTQVAEQTSVDHLLDLDRHFHESISALSKNSQLLTILKTLNDRINLVRWIALDGKRVITQREHQQILDALYIRDAQEACRLMTEHILHRHDDIMASIRHAYARVHTIKFATLTTETDPDLPI